MAVDPSNCNQFEIKYDTGSGKSRQTIVTKFTVDRKYEPVKALGHGAFRALPSAQTRRSLPTAATHVSN